MLTLFKNPRQIITVDGNGANYKRGKKMNNIGVVTAHSILVEDGKIVELIKNELLNKTKFDAEIDLSDKIMALLGSLWKR